MGNRLRIIQLMETVSLNIAERKKYSAPECRFFAVCTEKCIAQSPNTIPDDEYEDIDRDY